MYCRHCGKEAPEDSEFCSYCGKRLFEDQATPIVEEGGSGPLTQIGESKGEAINAATPMIADNAKKVQVSRTSKNLSYRLFGIIGVAVICVVLFVAVAFYTRHHELSAGEIAKLSDSVFTLHVYDKNHELISTGSGFVVNDDRTIVTNYHVVNQGYFVEAVSEMDIHYNASGATFFDEDSDIAILRLEAATNLKPLAIADSASVKVGDTIYAIGSPLGLKNTVSNGIVSAFRKNGAYSDFQITAPISPGSSGGVLLNAYGEAIGITYGSYSEGQNLNLAIPSVEFVDRLDENDVQSFEEIALFAAPLGNSVENYATHDTLLVQYGNYIFDAYNSEHEISAYNVATKETERLGIQGTNLSVYHGILYYVPAEDAIGTYNIATGEICPNILLDYPLSARVDAISDLYVSNHGLSVIYKVGFLDKALVQLDFDGTVIGRIDKFSGNKPVIVDADTLVDYDYENWELDVISLPDMECVSVPLDFEPGSICPTSDGFLFISDTTDHRYDTLVKYDLYTGEYSNIYKFDACTYGCFHHNGKIYYPATYRTGVMSSFGTGWETLTKEYKLNYMCFSDDEKLYAIGTEPSVDIIMAEKHTEYYVCVDLTTGQVEVLDKEVVT